MVKNLLSHLRLPFREDKIFSIALLISLVCPLLFVLGVQDSYEAPRLTFLLIALGALVIYLAFQTQFTFRLHKTQIIFLLTFLGLAILATIFSKDSWQSLLGNVDRRSDSLIFVFCWAFLIFLYSSFSKEKQTTLAKVWVVVGLLVSVLGLLHSFGFGFYSGTGQSFRPITPGFEGNQNFSAMLLTGILPFILPLAWAEKKLAWRIFYGASTFLMIWAVAVFASRGAILGLGLALLGGLGLLLIKKFNWKIIIATGVAGAVLAVLGLFFYGTTRLPYVDNSLNISADPSALNRLEIWGDSFGLITKHPWLGLGPANFIIGFQSLGNISLSGLNQFDDAHNLFLNLSVTLGLPATLALIALIIWSLIINLREFLAERTLLSWAILVSMTALVISMCFNPVSLANWLLLAFLIGSSNYNLIYRINNPSKLWLKTIMIILGIAMIGFAVLFFANEYIAQQVQNEYTLRNYEKAYNLSKYAIVSPLYDTLPKTLQAASLIKLKKDPAEIRPAIDWLLKHHQNNSSTYLRSGTLYFMLYQQSHDPADLKKSVDLMEKANQLQPKFVVVLIRQAYIAYLSGDKDFAEHKLLEALSYQDQDRNFTGHLLLGEIYLEEKRFPAMYQILKEAYNIAPNDILKKVLKEYQDGKFNRDRLPIYFPPVEVF